MLVIRLQNGLYDCIESFANDYIEHHKDEDYFCIHAWKNQEQRPFAGLVLNAPYVFETVCKAISNFCQSLSREYGCDKSGSFTIFSNKEA